MGIRQIATLTERIQTRETKPYPNKERFVLVSGLLFLTESNKGFVAWFEETHSSR